MIRTRGLLGFLVPFVLLVGLNSASGQTCVPAPAGAIGWWPAEGSAADIIGAKGGALDGDTAFAPGKVGRAFSFDGVDDAVLVSRSASLQLGTSDFTIEAWVNTTTDYSSGVGVLFLSYTGNDGGGNLLNLYGLWVDTSNRPQLFLRDGAGNSIVVSGQTAINDGQWHHVAGLRQGQTGLVYVDGEPEGSQTNPLLGSVTTETCASPYKIGATYTGFNACSSSAATESEYSGRLDELTIYNRALSPAEIRGIFDAGSAGKCSGSVSPSPCCVGDVAEAFDGTTLPTIFSLAHTGACSPPILSGGELRAVLTPGCGQGATHIAQGLLLDRSVAKLCGDFDVSIDYELVDFSIPSGSGARFRVAEIQVDKLSDDTPVAAVGLLAKADDQCPHDGLFWNAWTWPRTLPCGGVLVGPAAPAGALRMTRVGNQAHLYHGSGGTWSELYSNTVTTEDVYLAVDAGQTDVGGDAQEVRFDNLVILSQSPSCSCTPGEVDQGGVRVGRSAGSTILSWSPTLGAARYDLLRGAVSALPVGPGGADEACFDDVSTTSLTDPLDPAPGTAFWYLVRAENSCGAKGSYGFEGRGGVPASPRSTTSCP